MKPLTSIPSDRRTFQAAIEDNIGSCIVAICSLLALLSAVFWPYVKMNELVSSHLIDMTSWNDYVVVNIFVFVSYTLQYLLTAGILEYTNPRGFQSISLTDSQRQQRKKQIRKEILLGITAMFGKCRLLFM
jgi:hypothetical protein